METRVLVGIDPSMRNIGFAAAKKSSGDIEPLFINTVRTGEYKDYLANLKILYRFGDAFKGLLNQLESVMEFTGVDPSDIEIFVELPFGCKDSNAAFSLAFCSCVMGAIRSYGFTNIKIVKARDVKFCATGSKDAEKSEVIASLFNKYPTFNWEKNKQGLPMAKNEHAADAIGAILAGLLFPSSESVI